MKIFIHYSYKINYILQLLFGWKKSCFYQFEIDNIIYFNVFFYQLLLRWYKNSCIIQLKNTEIRIGIAKLDF